MANIQYGRPFIPQAQWTPMYQQTSAIDDGVYKPSHTSQLLEFDIHGVPTHNKRTFTQKHFGGLKKTLRAFVVTAIIVLVVNICWLGYAKSQYGIDHGYGTIKTGECASVKRLNTWFHLLINILSTLLLTGSNAFMAAYSSPTRQEIDKAHARRKWLHVGSMSIRNMWEISVSKSLVVLVLALSSISFHLLYNSLIYTELSVNNYYWAIATEDFVTGAAFNLEDLTTWYAPDLDNLTEYFQTIQRSASNWERLDQKRCIQEYSNAFLSTRRSVLIVTSKKNSTNSLFRYSTTDLGKDSDVDDNWWICSLQGQDGGHLKCNPQDYVSKAKSWEVFGYPVEYCLSEKVEDQCSVKFNMQVMLVVVSFNALKVLAMLWVLLRLDAQDLITCVGDAAASFMRHADYMTAGMCLADRRHINNYWHMSGPRIFNGGGRRRWGTAISKTRWILFTLLMLLAWGFVFIFGLWGFSNTKDKGVSLTPSGLASLGFGTLNQATLAIAGWTNTTDISPITFSIIANIPQIFLALIYLMYMSVMTAMFSAVDWARFSRTPQTLMVSSPSGYQRGIWTLGAPLGYGLSLLILQTLLHWFVSQSLFLVTLAILDVNGTMDASIGVVQNLGYSPIAMICSVMASGVLYLSALIFMLTRVPLGSPPVVSTCSAAISASCHIPPEMISDALVFEKLGWGATGDSPSGIGHCSLGPANMFHAGVGYAGPPIMGKPYAGLEEQKSRR